MARGYDPLIISGLPFTWTTTMVESFLRREGVRGIAGLRLDEEKKKFHDIEYEVPKGTGWLLLDSPGNRMNAIFILQHPGIWVESEATFIYMKVMENAGWASRVREEEWTRIRMERRLTGQQRITYFAKKADERQELDDKHTNNGNLFRKFLEEQEARRIRQARNPRSVAVVGQPGPGTVSKPADSAGTSSQGGGSGLADPAASSSARGSGMDLKLIKSDYLRQPVAPTAAARPPPSANESMSTPVTLDKKSQDHSPAPRDDQVFSPPSVGTSCKNSDSAGSSSQGGFSLVHPVAPSSVSSHSDPGSSVSVTVNGGTSRRNSGMDLKFIKEDFIRQSVARAVTAVPPPSANEAMTPPVKSQDPSPALSGCQVVSPPSVGTLEVVLNGQNMSSLHASGQSATQQVSSHAGLVEEARQPPGHVITTNKRPEKSDSSLAPVPAPSAGPVKAALPYLRTFLTPGLAGSFRHFGITRFSYWDAPLKKWTRKPHGALRNHLRKTDFYYREGGSVVAGLKPSLLWALDINKRHNNPNRLRDAQKTVRINRCYAFYEYTLDSTEEEEDKEENHKNWLLYGDVTRPKKCEVALHYFDEDEGGSVHDEEHVYYEMEQVDDIVLYGEFRLVRKRLKNWDDTKVRQDPSSEDSDSEEDSSEEDSASGPEMVQDESCF